MRLTRFEFILVEINFMFFFLLCNKVLTHFVISHSELFREIQLSGEINGELFAYCMLWVYSFKKRHLTILQHNSVLAYVSFFVQHFTIVFIKIHFVPDNRIEHYPFKLYEKYWMQIVNQKKKRCAVINYYLFVMHVRTTRGCFAKKWTKKNNSSLIITYSAQWFLWLELKKFFL